MKEYHIINPAAGHGTAQDAAQKEASDGAILYTTTGVGDARRYLAEVLSGIDEDVRVIVWGGDGTISEAVSGILDAGAGAHAILSARAVGTGNDFVRIFAGVPAGTQLQLDVLSCGGSYYLNMVNVGFDCAVADRMTVWKKRPLIRGSLAYLLALAEIFFRPLGTSLTVEFTDADGNRHTERGRFLLCAVANGQYCGGGFRGAPTADPTDGLAELVLFDVLPRRRILSMVGLYRAGTHVDGNGVPVPAIADVLRRYVRCREVCISGMEIVCRDGEISHAQQVSVSVLAHAIRYQV